MYFVLLYVESTPYLSLQGSKDIIVFTINVGFATNFGPKDCPKNILDIFQENVYSVMKT